MRRTIRSLAAVCAALFMLPLFGCRWASSVTVEIPGFDSSQVDGVWIWHGNELDGAYERSLEITLDEIYEVDGEELVSYSVIDADGETHMQLPARIERDPMDPDRAQIRFVILLLDPDGHLRASTYNSAGESGLSAEALTIESV